MILGRKINWISAVSHFQGCRTPFLKEERLGRLKSEVLILCWENGADSKLLTHQQMQVLSTVFELGHRSKNPMNAARNKEQPDWPLSRLTQGNHLCPSTDSTTLTRENTVSRHYRTQMYHVWIVLQLHQSKAKMCQSRCSWRRNKAPLRTLSCSAT